MKEAVLGSGAHFKIRGGRTGVATNYGLPRSPVAKKSNRSFVGTCVKAAILLLLAAHFGLFHTRIEKCQKEDMVSVSDLKKNLPSSCKGERVYTGPIAGGMQKCCG